MVGLIILGLAILLSLSWLWAGGIDYMHRNHPDYKGLDLFDEEERKRQEKERQERERQEREKKESPGFFSKIRDMVGGDPAIRGARRTSPELLEKELEARRKKNKR